MTPPARVVACMPAWNAAAFIGDTLEALAAQTYPALKVLISDDASDDGTAEICERFAAGDSRFRVIRQTRRLGWIGNSNVLLKAARGEYGFFAFHDDPPRPTYVASLVEALDRRPAAVLAFSDVLSRDRVDSYAELEGVSDRLERARRLLRMQGRWWIPNRGLFRLSAARAVGGMRRHLAGEYKADWPWLLALSLRGEFVRVPEPLIRKVWRDDSLSAGWNRRLRLWRAASVVAACAREVRRARPPLSEELRMHCELVRFGVGTLGTVVPRAVLGSLYTSGPHASDRRRRG
jgi:glycosyltransferase involved in cell wall biosynthesis